MPHIISYNRGGRGGPYYVAADLSETADRGAAREWASYDEAVAFCRAPTFAGRYGRFWGVLSASEAERRATDAVGRAVARLQGRGGDEWFIAGG